MNQVLIVDDDTAFTMATAQLIELRGFAAATAHSLVHARALLGAAAPDILLLDVMLPDGSGLELIGEVDPEKTRIIVMTGHPTVDIAVDSLRARVADFLIKPVEPQRLLAGLESSKRALAQASKIEPSDGARPVFEEFVGNSAVMLELYKLIDRVAWSTASVLIRGTSGTGKELVAQAIHQRSERRQQPFLSVNCGAVSGELIGSELFGHEKGSFTGATRQHLGYFERASGGTLFLDEVTEMPLELQVQLLRVLETGILLRIGGNQEIAVDVRIIAATNRNPQQAIAEGKLREDLYFRLAAFPIQVPDLDQRNSDISLLAQYFLDQLNNASDSDKRFAPGVTVWLEQRRWPGNVRELKNAVHRAYILAENELYEYHFPKPTATAGAAAIELASSAPSLPLTPPSNGALSFIAGATTMDDIERQVIFATLDHYKGNKPKTAQTLGISLKTLYNRLKQYEQDQ